MAEESDAKRTPNGTLYYLIPPPETTVRVQGERVSLRASWKAAKASVKGVLLGIAEVFSRPNQPVIVPSSDRYVGERNQRLFNATPK